MNDIDDLKNELRKALLEIANLRKQLAQKTTRADPGRWIPVEEWLPEIGTKALTLWYNGITSVEWRLNTKRGWSIGAKVTHWMPLPPLPREEVQG